ncbi:hypothetical protein GCM10009835_47690 [Planosporangium flavigriseum]|uniref:Uncharacterized protein n=1 Tax=Planosporangium flavigriseum TaxID=373681 RepID=A0A8J3PQC2_9ACTN|nr:hypothetical protein Pfl04_51920 [Planosporangium flavigriseum]
MRGAPCHQTGDRGARTGASRVVREIENHGNAPNIPGDCAGIVETAPSDQFIFPRTRFTTEARATHPLFRNSRGIHHERAHRPRRHNKRRIGVGVIPTW